MNIPKNYIAAFFAVIAFEAVFAIRPAVDDYMVEQTRAWVEVKFQEHGFIPVNKPSGHKREKYQFPNRPNYLI